MKDLISYDLMTKKILIVLVVAATVVGLFAFGQNDAEAEKKRQFLWAELTSPAEDKPFGGEEVVGDYYIRIRGGEQVRVFANLDDPPSGTVLEGWLVDVDSDYKLSVGKANDRNVLVFGQRMVNPSIYDVLVITAEPIGDTDPAPTLPPVGGAPIGEVFGQ